MDTLLLTGTIKPSPHILFLNIKDASTRYDQYIKNIIKYICFSDFTDIIFCENSGYKINDMDTLQGLAKIFGKKIEVIQFDGNHEKSVQKGRGFGENEIIEYAIHHSKLLQKSGSFIKVTGRYRCENINNIMHGAKDKEVCFSKLMPASLSKISTKAVNTAVFKTTVGFFNKVLAGAGEEVNDNKIIFLEHVYFEKLRKICQKISPLPEYPKMRGITGEGTLLKKGMPVETIMQIVHKLGITKI